VLRQQIEFVPERDAEIFASVPARPAVFLLRGSDAAAEPYVSKTANLRRRLVRLLGAPPTQARTGLVWGTQGISRRLNLRERVAGIEYTPTGSDFESGFLLYKTLREVFPGKYQERLRLRPAPLVRLHLENRFPRVSVTTHLSGTRFPHKPKAGLCGAPSVFYGPFPSRAAAEKFANDALDFFKIRRCTEELNPDPAHPGCVYSEMKMCLAPCFQGCSDEEYAAETARVVAFFDSAGESLARELAAERDRASAELQFEKAAAAHAVLEKLKPVLAQAPEIVHRIERLSALMIQPSAEPDSVTFFRIDGGCIAEPVTFSVAPAEGSRGHTSMERRILETLSTVVPPAVTQLETEEHLSILKRWYFRSMKVGEIFFADSRGELPMRRVVRGVSRVFKGEKASGDLSETARDYWVNRGRASEMGTEH
jgi:excinuclease ABC subunit C